MEGGDREKPGAKALRLHIDDFRAVGIRDRHHFGPGCRIARGLHQHQVFSHGDPAAQRESPSLQSERETPPPVTTTRLQSLWIPSEHASPRGQSGADAKHTHNGGQARSPYRSELAEVCARSGLLARLRFQGVGERAPVRRPCYRPTGVDSESCLLLLLIICRAPERRGVRKKKPFLRKAGTPART